MARRLLLAALLAVTAPLSAQQPEPQLPDIPVARVFREWQRAVNSRDSALVRAYVVAYEAERPEDPASVAESFGAVMNVVEQAGGIRVLQFRATSPERMDLLVQDARGTRLRMRLSVEEVAGAWRVAGIGLQPAEEGEALAPDPLPRRLPDQALADSLAARIDAQVARGRFDGSVLLARLDGTALLRRSWGTADRTRNLPNTPETRFALASMGKMFTAIAMAQLVEQGRVALDSPIARYVPDYPNRDFATRATVRQLLNHTSGLGAYWGPEFERRRTQLLTPADHLPLFVNDSLPFAPGARFRYSNAGFQVLGLIVERVAGMSYYDYVQRNIFDRAGMRSSGYYPPGGETPEGVATGYTAGPTGALRDNNGIREVRGGPAGGGLSTVDDLLRFARALESGQLVRRETLAQWTSGQSDNGRYGFGFMAMQQGGSRAYGHNGGAPGMATWFLVYPDRQLVLIALTNRDPGLMGWVMQPVMGAMGS